MIIPKEVNKMAKNKNTKTAKNSKTASKTSKRMKAEVAEELGVELGANATSRENGKVGAEVKKRARNNSPKKAKKSKSKK